MKKLISFQMISLDGYTEGPDGELDWHNTDEAFSALSLNQLARCGTLVFGRKTYEIMEAFWTSSHAKEMDPEMTACLDNLPKVVFSRSLDKVKWQHTRLYHEEVDEVINALRMEPGKDLLLLGSAELSDALMQKGLIDEFRIMINPVILGRGIPFFKASPTLKKMKLTGSRIFESGNVLLCYQPE